MSLPTIIVSAHHLFYDMKFFKEKRDAFYIRKKIIQDYYNGEKNKINKLCSNYVNLTLNALFSTKCVFQPLL